MPRSRPNAARSAVLSAPNPKAIVASAINYTVNKPVVSTVANGPYSFYKTPRRPSSESWQATAWSFYDIVGEFRYGVDWVAALASRVILTVTKDGEPTTDQPALDALDALYGGAEGQADMLRQVTRHWTVAGDCYLIGDKIDNADQADWLVGSATQTTQSSDGLWRVNKERFEANALVIRLWRPHPVDRTLADAPARAALPVLAEIDGLTQHVAAQIDSRLAGAGILFVPTEMTFASARPERPVELGAGDDPEPEARSVDALVETMIQTMSTAIADRSDPAALVPIVIQADGEAIRNVKYQTFATDLDKQSIELRAEAIRRLALSLDMPPEVLTGTSDLNHWSSWQIEEAAIKSHLEPLLIEICSALTTGYLRPALGGADADSYAIVPDTSALRLRPNRSKEAIELFDRGELNGETLLRENGFDPTGDAMDDKAFQRWLTVKVASGSATPDQVQAALKILGVTLDVSAGSAGDTTTRGVSDVTPTDGSAAPANGEQAPRQSRPAPSTKNHPVTGPPDPAKPAFPAPGTPAKPGAPAPAGRSASIRADRHEELVKASAVMVHRALERAGNRIKTQMKGAPRDPRTGEAPSAARIYEHVKLDFASLPMDKLLEDAWGTCDVFATDLGVEPGWLQHTLDSYTRGLLSQGRPMSMASLRVHLDEAEAV